MVSCVRGIIIKDNKILLVRHANRDFWCLPGGRIEGDETLKETLIRELEEELGIKEFLDIKFDSVYEFLKEQEAYREFWFRIKIGGDFDPENSSHAHEIGEWEWINLDLDLDLDKDILVRPTNLFDRIKNPVSYVNEISS